MDETETLLQETIRLVRESRLSIREICSGSGLKERWLRRLLDGDYEDPGVNKIERLNTFIRQHGKAA